MKYCLSLLLLIHGIVMASEFFVVIFNYERICREEFNEKVKMVRLNEVISPQGYMDREGDFRHYILDVSLNKDPEFFYSTIIIYSDDDKILFEGNIEVGSQFYVSEKVETAKVRFYFEDHNDHVIRIYEESLRSLVTRTRTLPPR